MSNPTENWVKVDPVALSRALQGISIKARGEWLCGFELGALGICARPGSSDFEVSGNTWGLERHAEAAADKAANREKKRAAGRLGNEARWGASRRSQTDRDAMEAGSRCDGFANRKSIAKDRRGEERRGDISPGGDITREGASPPPPDGKLPGWKACKVEGLRLQLVAADRKLRIECVKRDRGEPNETKESQREVDRLRSEILVLGVPVE